VRPNECDEVSNVAFGSVFCRVVRAGHVLEGIDGLEQTVAACMAGVGAVHLGDWLFRAGAML
jgi:hypothetical protein